MAAIDSCVLLECPACGAVFAVSGDCAAAFQGDASTATRCDTEWLPAVVRALCGCWIKSLSPQQLLHLYVTLLAA